MDEKLKCQVQAGLGRDLIGREVDSIDRLAREYGTPEIEIGEPRIGGDTQRPVKLTWVVDGAPRSFLFPATAPPEKPRNMAREHFERLARQHGGTLITETQRIGLGGRRSVERRVQHFPTPQGVQAAADLARRTRPRARGAGRPKAQSTRSSAASGDSGDDGSSEPPPGAGGGSFALSVGA